MRVPFFSFWALATTAILFVLLNALGLPTPLLIAFSIIWYIFGLGNAYAVYRHHHPVYETGVALPLDIGVMGAAPPGTFAVMFKNQDRAVYVPEGGNLMDAAKKQGVQIYYDVNRYTNCFGHGFCGTCRFTPDPKAPESLSEPTWQEKFTLGADVGKMRLACQSSVLGPCVVDNTVAEELGRVRHYTVINGALLAVFSVLMLGVILWMGADMIGLK